MFLRIYPTMCHCAVFVAIVGRSSIDLKFEWRRKQSGASRPEKEIYSTLREPLKLSKFVLRRVKFAGAV